MSGWIKLHRSITDWEYYDNANCMRLLIHLLVTVNYEPGTWKGVHVPAGSTITSVRKLSSELKHTIQQTRTALNNMQKSGVITRKVTHHYQIITLVKWEDYQNDNSESTHKTTTIEHTKQLQNNTQNTHQITTIKEIKKEESKKEEFIHNLNLNAIRLNLESEKDLLIQFEKYWTKIEKGKMKFELLPFFDFEKQLNAFVANREKFTKKSKRNGNTKQPSEDERKAAVLAKIAQDGFGEGSEH